MTKIINRFIIMILAVVIPSVSIFAGGKTDIVSLNSKYRNSLYYSMAFSSFEKGDYVDAWNKLKNEIEINPENWYAYTLFGLIYKDGYKMYGDAIKCLNKGEQLQYNATGVRATNYYKIRINIYSVCKDSSLLFQEYEKVLKIDPNQVEILADYGIDVISSDLSLATRLCEKAESLLTKKKDLSVSDKEHEKRVKILRAKINYKNEKYESALEIAKELKTKNIENEDALKLYVRCLIKLKKDSDIINECKELSEKHGLNIYKYVDLEKWVTSLNEETYQKLLSEVLNVKDKETGMPPYRLLSYITKDRGDNATCVYYSAKDGMSSGQDGYQSYHTILLYLGLNDELLKSLEEVKKAYPEYIHYNYFKSKVLRRMGDHNAAITTINEYINLNPEYEGSYSEYGLELLCLKDTLGAIDKITQALMFTDTDTDESEIRANRGFLYNKIGEDELAKEDFESSLDLLQDKDSANFAFTYAYLGDKEKALKMIPKRDSNDILVLIAYSMIGETDKAKEILEYWIDKFPGVIYDTKINPFRQVLTQQSWWPEIERKCEDKIKSIRSELSEIERNEESNK